MLKHVHLTAPEPEPLARYYEALGLTIRLGAGPIVTADMQPSTHGLTLTAGYLLSTNPSGVLAYVHKLAGGHHTIKQSRSFCRNILEADHTELARKLSGQGGNRVDFRFTDVLRRELITAAPSVIEAVCSFDCRLSGSHDAGSHTIFIGDVVAQATNPDREPLVRIKHEFTVPKR